MRIKHQYPETFQSFSLVKATNARLSINPKAPQIILFAPNPLAISVILHSQHTAHQHSHMAGGKA
ncbi:hypothetical protein NKT77_09875 [Moraxella sp. FZLJ2107]|uniref:hypothetical protein n=1 Tax=unclassified Moraxella TaxID=2685852 RepID=UPI0020C87D98|nr:MULTISPECIES: hypothetical protein [unclassified Moraxella]UTO04795.1 hypothetical protein NKT77_09875 [Moraxella sp. FZLJ2107]UTO21527.1 hypothetical protein NKU06_06680 [Moraxella sp. FZLJ2109]